MSHFFLLNLKLNRVIISAMTHETIYDRTSFGSLTSEKYTSCQFHNAMFVGAVLKNVIFRNCIFVSPTFLFAELQGVVFDSCKLIHPDFDGATLECKMINCSVREPSYEDARIKVLMTQDCN